MKRIIFPLALMIFTNNISAQKTDCAVLLDSLKGTYEGNCSSGKASGVGKAKGADSYEGDFKNGLPDGQGKYTWKNGNYYNGTWKKGMKEGKGELHYKVNGKDSVTAGFWKKDVYKGEYEEPYKIIEMGSAISYKNIQRIKSNKKSLYVSIRTGALGVANVDNYTILNGTFQRTNFSEMAMTKTVTFQDVEFPFRVRFNGIERGFIDVEFYEAGDWNMEIVL